MLIKNKRLAFMFPGLLIVFAAVFLFSFVSANDGPSLMNSEIPLMDGAKIIKEKQYMGSGNVELETNAPPEEVTRYYNTAMQQKGWPAGRVMSGQGASMLTIKDKSDQFTLAATPKNGKTRIVIALVRKSKLQTARSQNNTVKRIADDIPTKSPLKTLKHTPENFPVNLPVADQNLEMTAPTIYADNTMDLDQPLVISFSQPVDPAFFDFEISQDRDNWTARWTPEYDQVTLIPKVPPEPGQAVNLKASVLGGPKIQKNFTYNRLPPQRQLEFDLQNNRIDINQASRYRIYSLFDPSKIPETYRPTQIIPSGTPLLNTVKKDFDRLDEKTREELLPYFLSPLNPKSYYYLRLSQKNAQNRNGKIFSIVPKAWAGEELFPCLELYITENGIKIPIYGRSRLGIHAQIVFDLLSTEKIYEELKKLMGVDVSAPQNYIRIFLFNDDVNFYGQYFKAKNGDPTIHLYKPALKDWKHKGATLAHELFHAFQEVFTPLTKADTWIKECTAVWAEDYIDNTWNTEQEYISAAFELNQKLMQPLTTNTGNVPYGMYLFPYYVTRVSAKDPTVIRRIWENCASGNCTGDGAMTAVDNALGGKFDDIWKKFSLATLDVAPEDKRFPDTVVEEFGGMAPLKIKPFHDFNEIVLSKQGIGGSIATIQGINGCYFHVKNDNTGPTAPAVRFDLGSFKNDSDKIYVQSVITFQDGRKEYEDWTGRDERVFCLNVDSECFTEIHTVVSCSDHKKKKYKSFRITPVPMSRCYSGAMVITRKFEERETHKSDRKIAMYTTEIQSRTSSGNRWATLFLDLALEEKIHDDQHAALDIMEEQTREDHDPFEVKEMRKTMENIMKTTQSSLDSETGLLKIRYRVKACRIESAGGVYRSRSDGVREDSQGVVNQWETNFSRQWAAMGLDENTAKHLKRGHVRVDIYHDPDTGKIIWVKVPQLDIDMRVTEQSYGQTVRRAGDGYETIPRNNNDTKEEEFQLTFSSDTKNKKDLPMDPVWKAKESDALWATGEGRNERPVNRKISENGKESSTMGMAVETFEWSINLSREDS